MIKNIFFDMDGTLLGVDLDKFLKIYYSLILCKFSSYGDKAPLIAKTIIKGAEIMSKNDGTVTNDVLFFDFAEKTLNIKRTEIETIMNDLYKNDFIQTKAATFAKPEIREIIETLKQKGYRLFLTTNPLFPKYAIEQRLIWAGCELSDFEYIPSYDICNFTKPNENYIKNILIEFGLKAEETLLVGNDIEEDILVANKLNMPSYLLTDNIINSKNLDQKSTYSGDVKQFYKFINDLQNLI